MPTSDQFNSMSAQLCSILRTPWRWVRLTSSSKSARLCLIFWTPVWEPTSTQFYRPQYECPVPTSARLYQTSVAPSAQSKYQSGGHMAWWWWWLLCNYTKLQDINTNCLVTILYILRYLVNFDEPAWHKCYYAIPPPAQLTNYGAVPPELTQCPWNWLNVFSTYPLSTHRMSFKEIFVSFVLKIYKLFLLQKATGLKFSFA